MKTPIHITYRHVKGSPALDARIRQHIEQLEHGFDGILGCHVTIEQPARRRRGANTPFEVNVDLSVPGREIAVHSGRADRFAHADINAALRETFATLSRLLQDYVLQDTIDDHRAVGA